MDTPNVDAAWIIYGKIAFASLCGGIVRLLYKPASTLMKAIWLIFGCVTCGFYATPALAHYWNLEPVYRDGLAALIGFLGLTVAGGILVAVERIDFKAWILSLIPGRPGKQD